MARQLVFDFDGEESRCSFGRYHPEQEHGCRQSLCLDAAERPLTTARLAPDGRSLVPPGGSCRIYRGRDGALLSANQIRQVDAGGEPVDRLPSTLGSACELYGPVPPARILAHRCEAVQCLDATGLGPRLQAALAEGDIFETEYRYNASPRTQTIFILQGAGGLLGLICEPLALSVGDASDDDEAEDWQDETPVDLDEIFS